MRLVLRIFRQRSACSVNFCGLGDASRSELLSTASRVAASQGAVASNTAQVNKLDCRAAARHFTPDYFFGRGFWSSAFAGLSPRAV